MLPPGSSDLRFDEVCPRDTPLDERSQLAASISAVQPGSEYRIDGDWDRLSCNWNEAASVVKAVLKAGGVVVTLAPYRRVEAWDRETAKELRRVCNDAAAELRRHRERKANNRLAKIRRGGYGGGPRYGGRPFGYRYDPRVRDYVKDPVEYPILQWMCTQAPHWQRVVDTLTQDEIPTVTGALWRRSTVQQMVLREGSRVR